MLERYSPAELIGFARRLDPGMTARDFADAGRQLGHIDDEAFIRYGLGRARSPSCGNRSKPGPGPLTPPP
jgi:hypothetical protein